MPVTPSNFGISGFSFPVVEAGEGGSCDYPDEADVRLGVEYGFGSLVGTLVVPDGVEVSPSAILDCRDAVLAYVGSTGLQPAAAYVVRDKLHDIDGRLVRVFPDSYVEIERVAKRRVTRELKLVVTVEAVYGEPADGDTPEPVPAEWVDEQVEWVEQNIYTPLNTTGVRRGDLLAGRFRTMSVEVSTVYDPERLLQSKLFWGMLTLIYREEGVEG